MIKVLSLGDYWLSKLIIRCG